MVYSMTGFGRADSQDGNRRINVEIRSVNHRYLELSIRVPRAFSPLEHRIEEQVKRRILRGKVNVTVGLEGESGSVVPLRVNEAVAKRYIEIIRELESRYGLRGNLDVGSFIALPQVLMPQDEEFSEEAAWALLEPPLAESLDALIAMRGHEGEALARDLLERVKGIRRAVDHVTERIPKVVEHGRTRLHERLAEISEDLEYNRYRLETEISLFADRVDITEECVRLRSHAKQFEQFIEAPEPAGRRLKFLLEEMHRETNTIGSKGQDTEISREVIYMKEEVERIREQVLNIE